MAKPKIKKKPAARAPKRPRVASFDDRIQMLADLVEYDPTMPGPLFDLVGLCTVHRMKHHIPIVVTVDVEHEQTVSVGRCGQGHIHVVFNGQVNLATMNITALLAWSIALCCDRNESWTDRPTVPGVLEAMREIISDPYMDEIREFATQVYGGVEPIVTEMLARPEAPTLH